MAKCSTDTCCLTLPLRLEKWQEDRLAKRFEIARQIYNTMVRAELKKLRAMEQSVCVFKHLTGKHKQTSKR